MNLFYHPASEEFGLVELEVADAVHLTKVLRMKEGMSVHVTNGRGAIFEGVIALNGKHTQIQITKKLVSDQQQTKLELVIALTKNQDRLEWFVEKAVEIGVGKIRLINAEHSERTHIRIERLQRVAISAMKQSLKMYLPEIVEPVAFTDWLSGMAGVVCIAHCRETPHKKRLQDVLVPGVPSTIAIGPEGDFSVAELKKAYDAGCIPVSLGDSRLRTETAALCAVLTYEIVNQKP